MLRICIRFEFEIYERISLPMMRRLPRGRTSSVSCKNRIVSTEDELHDFESTIYLVTTMNADLLEMRTVIDQLLQDEIVHCTDKAKISLME